MSDPDTTVDHPSQIAVIGNAMKTDIVLANCLGAFGVYTIMPILSTRIGQQVSNDINFIFFRPYVN